MKRAALPALVAAVLGGWAILGAPGRSDAEHARSVLERLAQLERLACPKGTIVAWSGGAGPIPDGWALCDGTRGTPDLRDRFLKGAAAGEAVLDLGGSHWLSDSSTVPVGLNVSQMPRHLHDGWTTEESGHVHEIGGGIGMAVPAPSPGTEFTQNSDVAHKINSPRLKSDPGAPHKHEIAAEGGGAAHSHPLPQIDKRPAYATVIFIMRIE